MIISFFSVPILLNFLGKESFGVWQTILSILGWISLSNFGLGNGLRNLIAKLDKNQNKKEINKLISTSFIISLVVTIFIFVLTIIIIQFVDVSVFFKGYTSNFNLIKKVLIISIFFFCLNLIFGLIHSIIFAFEKSHYVSLISLLFNAIFISTILFLGERNDDKNLLIVAFFYGFFNLIITLLFGIYIFRKYKLSFHFKTVKKQTVNKLIGLSGNFFLLQIAMLFLFSIDNILIGYLLGVIDVTSFSIINKVNFVVINLYSMLLIQLWSTVTVQQSKNNLTNLSGVIKNLKLILILPIIFYMVFFICYDEFFKFWLGQELNIKMSTVIILAIYTIFHLWNALHVNITNGLGMLKNQILSYSVGGVLYIFFALVFVNRLGLGINGICIAKVIGILIPAVVSTYEVKKYFYIK